MYLFQFDSLFEVQLNKFDGSFADKEEELDEFSVIVGFVSIKISGSEHLSDLKPDCLKCYSFLAPTRPVARVLWSLFLRFWWPLK